MLLPVLSLDPRATLFIPVSHPLDFGSENGETRRGTEEGEALIVKPVFPRWFLGNTRSSGCLINSNVERNRARRGGCR